MSADNLAASGDKETQAIAASCGSDSNADLEEQRQQCENVLNPYSYSSKVRKVM